MRLIRAIAQRITDWRRERRINALAASCLVECDSGRSQPALRAWEAMKAEIDQRSPQQIARMEANFRG